MEEETFRACGGLGIHRESDTSQATGGAQPVTEDNVCQWGNCGNLGTETHWRLENDGLPVWAICGQHSNLSKQDDRSNWSNHRHLYLPIVQPVMGSEQALAMEAALFAVGRLLLLCKRHDGTQAERDEAEQTLELLREAQAEAWLRRAHKEAA